MNKATEYAQTLYKASQEKQGADLDTFFSNFVELLKSKDQYKLLPAIYKAYELLVANASKGGGTTFIVREAALAEQYKKELEAFNQEFNLDEVTVVEDKNIVGGFVAKNSTSLLDRSYRKGLMEMYKRLKG